MTGIDIVPEFIENALETYPGPQFRLSSMTDLDTPEQSVSGILSWYSTIHLPPTKVERLEQQFTERPDRRYAAIAARAS